MMRMNRFVIGICIWLLLGITACGKSSDPTEVPETVVSEVPGNAMSPENDPPKTENAAAELPNEEPAGEQQIVSEPAEEETEWERLWRQNRTYPLVYGDEAWESFGYEEKIEILNPPEDLLESFTPEELADLFLHYPLFPYMPDYTDNQKDIFFEIYREYSTIAARFLESEDRFPCLMEAWRQNDFNVEAFDGSSVDDWFDASVWADRIVADYLLAYGADLTEEEKDLYREIYAERDEQYYSRSVNESRSSLEILFDTELPHRRGCAR